MRQRVALMTLVMIQGALAADLRPETVDAFLQYVANAESRISGQLGNPERMLYVDTLERAARDEALGTLKSGGVFMRRFDMQDAAGTVLRAPGGLIHHWIGDVFIPGTSVALVLDMVQDYNRHEQIYRPDVIRSKLLARQDNNFRVALSFRKKKVISVTLNTEHDVQYVRIDPAHWWSRSVSTRIAEVEDAGQSTEREKPVGHDRGFLWRIHSYWRFVERDGGVYVECESVSLTRDIPAGLSWLIKGLVASVSRDSLQHTLKSTREGALARRVLP